MYALIPQFSLCDIRLVPLISNMIQFSLCDIRRPFSSYCKIFSVLLTLRYLYLTSLLCHCEYKSSSPMLFIKKNNNILTRAYANPDITAPPSPTFNNEGISLRLFGSLIVVGGGS